jgi:hypothetical protein
VVMSERGARNADAQDFVNWLRAEAEMTRGSVAANSHAG